MALYGSNAETEILLNVYDLCANNKYSKHLGIGIYHSAIEIHGYEFEYGGNPNMFSTGVFRNAPRKQN